MHQVESIVETKEWTETTVGRGSAYPRFAHVSASHKLSGELAGTSRGCYVLLYTEDGAGMLFGLECVRGEVDGERGSFVYEVSGDVRDGHLYARWRVVAGSGKGVFRGLCGEASCDVRDDGALVMRLRSACELVGDTNTSTGS